MNINTSHILDLWNDGKDTYDIARILGVFESDIYNALAQINGDTISPPERRKTYSAEYWERTRAVNRKIREARP